MKHYVVTKGDYSDYHIIAVCSDREDAEAIARKFDENYENTCVEEYDDGKEVFIEQICYFFKINRRGEIIDFRENSCEYFWENSKPSETINGDAYLYVLAKDEEHAKKIAVDRWSQWMARRKGLC